MPDEAADVAAVLDHEQNDAKQAQQCRQLAAGGEHADGAMSAPQMLPSDT